MDESRAGNAAVEDEAVVRDDGPVVVGSLLAGVVFPLALLLLMSEPVSWRDLLDPGLWLVPVVSACAGWALYRIVNGLLRLLRVPTGAREHAAWRLVWVGGPLALVWFLSIGNPPSDGMMPFLLALLAGAVSGGAVGHRGLAARLRRRASRRGASVPTGAVDPALAALLTTARRDLVELEAFARSEDAADAGVDGTALLAHGRQSLAEMERLAERLTATRSALALEVQDERLRERADRSMERLLELSEALEEAAGAVRACLAGGSALGGLGRQAERLSRMVDSQDELEDELEARVSRS